jgi:hypothetical protein
VNWTGVRELGYRRKRRSWSVKKNAKNGQMVRVITTSAALAEAKLPGQSMLSK